MIVDYTPEALVDLDVIWGWNTATFTQTLTWNFCEEKPIAWMPNTLAEGRCLRDRFSIG